MVAYRWFRDRFPIGTVVQVSQELGSSFTGVVATEVNSYGDLHVVGDGPRSGLHSANVLQCEPIDDYRQWPAWVLERHDKLTDLDPNRGTGRTTGCMLQAISKAILNRGTWIEFIDHYDVAQPWEVQKSQAERLNFICKQLGLQGMQVKFMQRMRPIEGDSDGLSNCVAIRSMLGINASDENDRRKLAAAPVEIGTVENATAETANRLTVPLKGFGKMIGSVTLDRAVAGRLIHKAYAEKEFLSLYPCGWGVNSDCSLELLELALGPAPWGTATSSQ